MPTAIEVLRALAPHHRDQVRAQMRRATLSAGTLLIEEGEEDDALVYIEAGEVVIKRGGVPIDRSGAGELLGEMALFGEGRRTASVELATETTLLFLDQPSFEVLRATANPFAFWIEREALRHLVRRLRRLDARIAALSEGEPSPWVRPPPTVFARIAALFAGAPGVRREPQPVDAVKLLEESRLFAGTPRGFLVAIAEALELRAVDTGTFLCEQGSPGDELYLIARGRVDVLVATGGGKEVRVHKLAQVGTGDAVGLSALADGAPRAASCVAVSPVDALVLGREAWQGFRDGDHRLGSEVRLAMIRGFSAALAEAAGHVVALEQARAGRPKPPVMPPTPGPLAERDEAPAGTAEPSYSGPVEVFLDPRIGMERPAPEAFHAPEPHALRAAAAAEISGDPT